MPVPFTLPIVSISPYLPALQEQFTEADRARVAESIHQACRDIGFFYLRVDDYLDRNEMHSVLERGREFFLHATEDEKAKIGLDHGDGVRGELRKICPSTFTIAHRLKPSTGRRISETQAKHYDGQSGPP